METSFLTCFSRPYHLRTASQVMAICSLLFRFPVFAPDGTLLRSDGMSGEGVPLGVHDRRVLQRKIAQLFELRLRGDDHFGTVDTPAERQDARPAHRQDL